VAAVLVARDSSIDESECRMRPRAGTRGKCKLAKRVRALLSVEGKLQAGVEADDAPRTTSRAQQRAEQQRQRRKNKAATRADRLYRGSEFVGLYVRVPWSMWGGEWFECDEYETGIVVEYVPPSKKEQSGEGFTVAFDPSSATSDISLSYGELLGEVPCCVTRDAALFRRDHIPVGGPAIGRAPRPTKSGGRFYWDRPEQGRDGSTESARGGTIEPIQVHARPRLHALRPYASRPHALALNAYR